MNLTDSTFSHVCRYPSAGRSTWRLRAGQLADRCLYYRHDLASAVSALPKNRGFKAAVLIQHGLNDFNTKPRHAVRLWHALKANGVAAKIW